MYFMTIQLQFFTKHLLNLACSCATDYKLLIYIISTYGVLVGHEL